jgi:hypothetical protein
MTCEVSLVVNTFERNLATVLAPGFFPQIERQNSRRFGERILLINNVDDRERAAALARHRIDEGEITAVHFVDEQLPTALEAVDLSPADLGRPPYCHFSDYLFAAPFVANSPYLLYWDGDVRMDNPVDWVGPALDLLRTCPRVFSASARPCWWSERRELTLHVGKDFAFGYGFSDQMFLARTAELRQPIYNHSAPACFAHPTSHVCQLFEQRVNSYMRRHRRFRAVHLASRYEHQGRRWYWPTNPRDGLLFIRNRLVSRALKLQPIRSNPAWKL